jgi:hypothetical protein
LHWRAGLVGVRQILPGSSTPRLPHETLAAVQLPVHAPRNTAAVSNVAHNTALGIALEDIRSQHRRFVHPDTRHWVDGPTGPVDPLVQTNVAHVGSGRQHVAVLAA